MEQVQAFVNDVMVPDLIAIAPFDRLFPRGAIFDGKLTLHKPDPDQTRMYTKFSWFDDKVGGGKHPLDSGQEPINYTGIDPLDNKGPVKGKYDWTQAVRYGDDNRPMEVGPLAQMLVAHLAGRPDTKKAVDDALKAIGQPGNVGILMSDLGRIAARVLKAKVNADNALRWADELLDNIKKGNTKVFTAKPIPGSGIGKGGWDAPRGRNTPSQPW
ncbi:MAG: hypothetical protein COW32_10605 [Candidatus Aquicultor secundus]|uniref:Uncharacterized protein n=1 Tax=Candidatus Aquicultor secundus TaxID=1973895 RepID=A0A2M7T852_9ACTN|nr:nickel-dependent hydrogenase large subunit [Candidatus Aquicultor secundus]NCO65336.1 nickel-dependent hydrogenase large subunit [Solirubrobacter sp.]OIO88794.1 MAG: hypothetical protein AUK32_00585 [Candidatus Aquicultor secundus]PIU27126.1 MAG: hypothetical protein COT10_05110 [Candidatus Aquicultor secundus]PIW21304.1 MAG: hypothetical protein COW32_10605 [Candidatus Aquicultor secundus]PIX52154.1 MAG: hypothetical protein COZ51_05730 [Candidatus Aquicultor secundus]